MIYGYIRVSTEKQSIENQKFEIQKFCQQQNIKTDKLITETISGIKDFEKRKLGILLKKMQKGDILICTEISRLGRNLFQIMMILNLCIQKNIQVLTIKDNYKLGSDIQSKVLAFAFGLAAEIERNLISQRTKEALNRIKANGKKLGRKTGSKNKNHILDGKEKDIINLFQKGISQNQIAKTMGVSTRTIYNFLSQQNIGKSNER